MIKKKKKTQTQKAFEQTEMTNVDTHSKLCEKNETKNINYEPAGTKTVDVVEMPQSTHSNLVKIWRNNNTQAQNSKAKVKYK